MAAEAIAQVLAILTLDSPTQALVGTNITPLVRTQDIALPCITLQRVTMVPTNAFSGDAGLDSANVQVDCYASTYAQARAIAIAVRNALKPSILMTNEIDAFEDAQNPGVYRITQEWQVWS